MGRRLTEAFTHATPLKVDREKGIIFRMRVLGPTSVNSYGVNGVNGTEYSEGAHADALRMYEGQTCGIDHIRNEGSKERSVRDVLGKFHNPVTEKTSEGPVTYADLHYLKSNQLAESVCEDAERGLGAFGLSHDAYAGKERVDRPRKKLVIESLRSVNSIDLVSRAATNRNLAESETPTVKTTLRKVLESLKDLPVGKSAWKRHLIEDGDMAASDGRGI